MDDAFYSLHMLLTRWADARRWDLWVAGFFRRLCAEMQDENNA